MKKHASTLLAATILLAISTPAVMAYDSSSRVQVNDDHGIIINGDHGIQIERGDIVIHSDNGSEARITSSGALSIDGKNVPVNDQQKVKLLQYANTVKDIETQGMKLGMDAAGFALNVVGDVFAALLSGEDENSIDKEANARARKFKQRALPICKDVHSLKLIQDELTASIQSFRPFAIIEAKDADDCERDINSDD
ncbi:MAG: DUF2884 family protein [Gammaproteobacteria bacterium]